MKLAAFPPEAPFLPALATLWLRGTENPADGLLLLPSRRAASALAGAFLEANNGKALLLPRIAALGALDETGLALTGALDLPPAIPPIERQALLAALILKRNGAQGAPTQLHAAWALAADLAALLDEAAANEIDLAATLPGIVAEELATHWQTTLDFLTIITTHWPAILAERGQLDAGTRQAALLDAQAAAWAAHPPPHRIWLVTAGGPLALTRLARTIATLPHGRVILPGYDRVMGDESWDTLEDTHAQAGIARLLAALGARREDIDILSAPPSAVPSGRAALLSRALLPAASLSAWQQPVPLNTAGLSRLDAPDEAATATAIAMVLRAALEIPGRTAALITPDRALATRTAAALARFGILADDSAGEPLAHTPPATLLRLLARAAAAEFAPLPLLALLQHPLTAAGLPPAFARETARRLELAALRGPRPSPGFDGLKFRLADPRVSTERTFLERLELMLAPVALPVTINPAEALRRLLTAAESLAATPDAPGAAALWSGEAGTALSERFLQLLPALEPLPDIEASDLPDLLDALLDGPVIRKPRNKDGHPRIAIWGVQEAALQSVDVAVLGGLTEGVWPAAAEPGPWLSRPMRAAAGLPSPEQATGQAAHAFFALAASCPEIILAAPARRDRAPAVPARWLTRLAALLKGAGLECPAHPGAAWAAALDRPITREARPKPAPRPPAAARPTKLSVSDFATLLADPYALYARKILRLDELAPLDEESDPALFGDIAHAGLAAFFSHPANLTRPDALEQLTLALQSAMREARPRAALEAWWAARLARIAGFILETEQGRLALHGRPLARDLERSGQLALPGGFTLTARADRIERRADGAIMIADYKTGTVPNQKQVETGTAPQLALEAVMAERGAFGPEFQGTAAELLYLKISGRHEPGQINEIRPDKIPALIARAAAALPATFARFADPATAYLARPHPDRTPAFSPYAGISRQAEWEGAGES